MVRAKLGGDAARVQNWPSNENPTSKQCQAWKSWNTKRGQGSLYQGPGAPPSLEELNGSPDHHSAKKRDQSCMEMVS